MKFSTSSTIHPAGKLLVWLALFSTIWLASPAFAAVVSANFATASSVPVTAATYTAAGNSVNLSLGFAPAVGTVLTVVKATDLPFINGRFSNLAHGQRVGLTYAGQTYPFLANYYGGSGNDLVLEWEPRRIVAWGANGVGELGIGGRTSGLRTPTPIVNTGVLAGKTVISVSMGNSHSLALCSDGTIAAWGWNFYGQLGNEVVGSSAVPVEVNRSGALAGKTVIAVAAFRACSYAICSDGSVAAWGYNRYGELGDGTSGLTSPTSAPVEVFRGGALAGKSVVAITGGRYFRVALCSDGTLVGWGVNGDGQLGNGTTRSSNFPVVAASGGVLAGRKVIAVSAEESGVLALCDDGFLASWGSDAYGELGRGGSGNSLFPVAVNRSGVLAGKNVVSISGGRSALCSEGTLAIWGKNEYGALGNNSSVLINPLPVLVDRSGILAGKEIVELGIGTSHSLVRCSDGTMAAWGYNVDGQLGDGTNVNRLVPVNSGASAIASGERYMAAFHGIDATHTFAIIATPRLFPTAETRAATSITATSAVLNARITAANSETAVSFGYSLDIPASQPPLTFVNVPPPSITGNAPIVVSLSLPGMIPGRTYRFRAVATNGTGTSSGTFFTFTTTAALPTATTLVASSITSTTAVLNGTVSANGAQTDVYFRYFAPGVAGVSAPSSPSVVTTQSTSVSLSVSGLLPGTTYTYATRASNSVGDAYWGNVTFTTLPDPTVGGLAEPLDVPVAGGSVYGSVIQPDGRTLIFGDFTSVHGRSQGRMARLNADGSLETGLGFNPGANGPIYCAVVLADGKILIGGDFTTLQPRGTGTVFTRNRVARLLSDGTVDTTFGDPGVNAFALSMAVQPDGAVLVGGDFTSFMSTTRNRIARITPSGGIDANFNPNSNGPVYGIVPLLDGKVLLGGNFSTMSGVSRSNLARVNGATGVADASYTASVGGEVYSIAQQRDGKAILGGLFTSVNTVARNKLARLNADGTLDMTFNLNITGGNVFTIALQANKKIILGGSFIVVGGVVRNKVARVDDAGVLDGFNPNVGGGDVRSIALQANGKAQIGGSFTSINGSTERTAFALLNNETAYQTLEKRSASEVFWSRGGSAPEVLSVAFDYATIIGTVFSPVGNGTRVDPAAGDWRLSSISPVLPLTGQIRVRARTASGYLSGSSGIMEQSLGYIHSPPVVTTTSVDNITGTTARLRGSVTSSGLAAVPAFKLDTSTAYTQPLRIATPASVTGTANISFNVTGLTPGTTYVFRATAENAGARMDGADITFTTLANLQVNYLVDGTDTAPSVNGYKATGRQVTFTLNRSLNPGETLRVLDNTSSSKIVDTFDNLVQNQEVNLTFGGVTYPYVAYYYGGDGNDLVLLWRHTRALTWGWNSLGQLGNRNQIDRGIPGDLDSSFLDGKTIVSMAAGFHHSLALCSDGTLASWGDNREGQLGIGYIFADVIARPVTVAEETMMDGVQAIAISAGRGHSLALYSWGAVYAWGDNSVGQLGNGSAPLDSALPSRVLGALDSKTVIGISAGEYHNLAVCDDGSVAVWGSGANGRLGTGSVANQNTPVLLDLSEFPFGPGEKIVEVAAGRSHSMARTNLGKVITWGLNAEGQLGLGTTVDRLFPQQISGLNASRIYGGGSFHSMALRSDGQLMTWGTNIYGQLGYGGFANSLVPTAINTAWQGGKSISFASTSDHHNLAIRSDGSLHAWGLGNEGRLGDDDTSVHTQSLPIQVNSASLDPGDRWQSIFGGSVAQHSLGIVAVSLTPTIITHDAVVYSESEALITAFVNPHGRASEVSFSYGLTPSYGTNVAASPASFSGVTPQISGAYISGLLPGRTYHYRAFLTQPGLGGISGFGEDRTFTTYTRLQMWRYDHFTTFENTGDAADSADPDNDHISNLIEFALGLNPRAFSQLPPMVETGVNYRIEFTQPFSEMGVSYGAEWSTTLAPGSWLPLTDSGVGLNHIFTLNSTGQPKAFMRLRVTNP